MSHHRKKKSRVWTPPPRHVQEKNGMILIIDDDPEMQEAMSLLTEQLEGGTTWTCSEDVMLAIDIIGMEEPDVIFLDVMLNGPNGFTLLNELQSDVRLARIPIVLMSSLPLPKKGLEQYNIVGTLNKATMKPPEVLAYMRKYHGRVEALRKKKAGAQGSHGPQRKADERR